MYVSAMSSTNMSPDMFCLARMQQLFRLRLLEADTQWLNVAKSLVSLSFSKTPKPHASHGRLTLSEQEVALVLGAREPRIFRDQVQRESRPHPDRKDP